jgi:hypothetical protein
MLLKMSASPPSECACYSQEFKFCLHCGRLTQNQITLRTCAHCEWQCPFETARHCGLCGYAFQPTRSPAPAPAVSFITPPLGPVTVERSDTFKMLFDKMQVTSKQPELDELFRRINTASADGKFFANEVTILRSLYCQKLDPTRKTSTSFNRFKEKLENIITPSGVPDFELEFKEFLLSRKDPLKTGEEDEIMNLLRQRKDELKRGMPRQSWAADESSKTCNICDALFTFIKRRHHCRCCGKLVCGSCSERNFKDANVDLDRVCDKCYTSLTSEENENRDGMSQSGGPLPLDTVSVSATSVGGSVASLSGPNTPTTKRCPGCQAVLAITARFCASCGLTRVDSLKKRRCSNCQSSMSPKTTFCGNCGHPASAPPLGRNSINSLSDGFPTSRPVSTVNTSDMTAAAAAAGGAAQATDA